ncbi:putative T7SS-secreted protein [Streptomyces sp. NPDC006476]|uniref:putative T7SS-secreted protein n=1 Tax=Streptomyces sp. NPDC006476 TaxID=3157175 RepID=UPI0033A856E3
MSYDFSGVDWQTARYDDKEFAPGDPYEVARLGKRIADTAKLIEEQAGKLNNLVDGNGWDSDAGRAFQDKTHDTVGLLTKTHQRYAAAASALGSTVPYEPIADTVRENWATALNHAQNLVRTALKKAQAADADGSRYQKQIDQHPGPDEHPDKQKLKRQKDAADGELEAAKRDLRRALEYRDTQAGYAAKAIRDALDHDGLKDPAHHWWDNWKDWVAEVGHWAGVAAAALGVLALVLSWVPILGEVLGALALIASVVALVCDTVSALDGKGTWLDVAIDVVGVLSFGAGRVLGTTAKEAAMAARASSAVKDFQLAREVGLNPATARDLAEALNGVKPGEMSKALAEGPAKLLPRMRSVVKETFNVKGYVNDIRDAREVHAAARAFAEEAPKMSEIADSSFKTMAGQAKTLYYGSQALPLLAGWANLAHTHSGEPFVTGPNWLQGAKELPVIGAGGTPFYNWRWSTSG